MVKTLYEKTLSLFLLFMLMFSVGIMAQSLEWDSDSWGDDYDDDGWFEGYNSNDILLGYVNDGQNTYPVYINEEVGYMYYTDNNGNSHVILADYNYNSGDSDDIVTYPDPNPNTDPNDPDPEETCPYCGVIGCNGECEDYENDNCDIICPDDKTLDLTNCSCTPKPKKSWYLDVDNDGFADKTKEHYESPGAGWKKGTPLGMDCDDTKKCVTTDCTKVDWYLDNDTDGWYAEIKNDYKSCKPEGKWNTTSNDGEDCDDNDDKYKFKSLDVAGGNIFSYLNTNLDMESGDLSFNDINEIITRSKMPYYQQIIVKALFKIDEFFDPYLTDADYIAYLKDYAEYTTFNDDLINEIFDRFSENNATDIFSSENLTNTILNNSNFSDYENIINDQLVDAVKGITKEGNNISIEGGLVSFSSNGALISWHGTSEIEIELNSLVINCDKFSYDITIDLTDHFGLDNGDLFKDSGAELATRTLAFFRKWYILQRVRGVKPFKTNVSKSISKSNVSF